MSDIKPRNALEVVATVVKRVELKHDDWVTVNQSIASLAEFIEKHDPQEAEKPKKKGKK